MDERTQLTNLIVVLCQQQYVINKRAGRFENLANEVVRLIKEPANNGGGNDGSVVVRALLDIVKNILSKGVSSEISINGILEHMRTTCTNFPKVIEQLEKNLIGIEKKPDAILEGSIALHCEFLEKWINTTNYRRILNKASFDFDPEGNRAEHLKELQENLEKYTKDTSEIRHVSDIPCFVDGAMVNDREEFKEKFIAVSEDDEEDTASNIFKFDLDGLNQGFGDGGMKHPSATLVNALTGCGKTSSTMRMMRGLCKMNDGYSYVKDKDKKPLILVVTMENTVNEIVGEMYHDMLVEESGMDYPHADGDTAFEYLNNTLLKNNWHLQIIFGKKKTVTVNDIDKAIEFFENQGYQLVMLVVDYLQLMDYGDPTRKGRLESQLIKDTAGQLEAITKAQRNASYITCAQIKSELKNERSRKEFAKEIGPRLETAFCKGLGDEFDYCLTVNVTTGEDGRFWWQCNFDKNRKSKTVTPGEMYLTYAMSRADDGTQGGFIRPDITVDGIINSQVCNTTGGARRVDGGGDSWDDF